MADVKKNNKKPNSNKTRNYGSKNEVISPRAGTIEYKMSQEMADTIIKESKSKQPAQEILCDYVNTQFGIKGRCVKVLIG